MKLAYIHLGDLIEVNKGGRRVFGKVVEIRDGLVQFEPLCRGISYRHASAREIVGDWAAGASYLGSLPTVVEAIQG